MHPPLLPNPPGEGLEFYKRHSFAEGKENVSVGMDLSLLHDPFHFKLVLLKEKKLFQEVGIIATHFQFVMCYICIGLEIFNADVLQSNHVRVNDDEDGVEENGSVADREYMACLRDENVEKLM